MPNSGPRPARSRSTSSTGPTSCSATTSPCRRTSIRTASRSPRCAGVLGSVLGMLEQGATHVGVATDHVVESFRNDLWLGYKTSEGMDPELLTQFPMLEDALVALGVDRLADGRARGRRRRWPRRRGRPRRPARRAASSSAPPTRTSGSASRTRWSCSSTGARSACSTRPRCGSASAWVPRSIPDYLALVGDTADGFPGPPGLGGEVDRDRARALRAPRRDPRRRGAVGRQRCAARRSWRPRSRAAREAAELFLDLATLRTDADVGSVDDWEWRGPAPELAEWAKRLGAGNLVTRAERLAHAATG